MTAARGQALEQALAYYRAPALVSVASQRPLPDDVIELLRLAAGDQAQAARSAAASGETPPTVVEAAVFFIQQVLFVPGADSFRVLGVNPDAPGSRIKEHYRWLVRWLHPDRNADDWDSIYAERVTRAWQELRRRASAGEGALAEADEPAASDDPPTGPPGLLDRPRAARMAKPRLPRIPREHPAAAEPLVSPRTARRLPMIVLGGLGASAMVLLGLAWFAQRPPKADALSSTPPRAEIPASRSAPLPALRPAAPTVVPTTAPQPDAVRIERELSPLPVATAAPVPSVAESAFQPSAPSAAVPVAAALPSPDVRDPRPTVISSALVTAESSPPRAVAAAPAIASGPSSEDASAGSVAPAGPTARDQSIPSEAASHDLLRRFSHAYAAGDINGLMRLFTRDASNNRGGRDAIVYDYQSLFSGTTRRELRLTPTGWLQRSDGATVLARYDASVTVPDARRAATSRGEIRFSLRQEDGQLKISQVRHDNQ